MSEKINLIKKKIANMKQDAALISSVANITYLTNYANFSVVEREAFLLITNDDSFILTDGRYKEAVENLNLDFKLIEITTNQTFASILKKFAKQYNIAHLGVESDDLRLSEYQTLSKHFSKISDLNLKQHRSIKSPWEIEQIRKACRLTDDTFNFFLKKITSGISEKELASKIELYIKNHNGDLAFETIVAFGKNSSIPHHQTGQDIVDAKNGQFILIDFGAKVGNYCADMTRTIFFGKPSAKQKQIYKIVLEAQTKAVSYIKARLAKKQIIKAKEVDKIARDFIKALGFASIPHGLGHGIGLEVHEFPRLSPKSKNILKDGMVFSIEPGIYIPNFGGVRIEDIFAIVKGELKQLTKSSKVW